MKKKKLSLTKTTISNLENSSMMNVKGGIGTVPRFTFNGPFVRCFIPTPTKRCRRKHTGPVHAC